MAALAAVAHDWSVAQPGGVVLSRHALAMGGGDPPGFKLDDCRTQRKLSDEGRAQALRIGKAFKALDIVVGAASSSQWRPTRETVDITSARQRVDPPAFNSFFGDRDAATEKARAAQALLAGWRGPGVLVVTTHQVNITALKGNVPASGEGVVVKPSAQGLSALGRIAP